MKLAALLLAIVALSALLVAMAWSRSCEPVVTPWYGDAGCE